LNYGPFRHPWRRVLPLCAIVVGVLVVASLLILPVAHSFSYEFAVTDCSAGSTGVVHYVSLPSGVTFAYRWASSDGSPIKRPLNPTALCSRSGPVISCRVARSGRTSL
jgi:hypothetical protein